MSDYVLGLDLGGTNVVIAVVEASGKLVGRETFASEVEKGPEDFVVRAGVAFEKLFEEAGVRRDQVRALGIGSPGPLSVAQGRIIRSCNMPEFSDFRIRAALSERLGVAAVLDNDANAACWGEYWLGAGQKVQHMVMFTLGTGVGGGIVIDGELVHGSEDNAAELGHIIIVPDGRLCNCGQRGCVEAYASASHTAARAREAVEAGGRSSLRALVAQGREITSKDVFDHARQGDALAVEVVEGTCRALAQVCVIMRHVTEPEMIVLAGGMIQAGNFLLERVRRYTDEMMWRNKREDMTIALAMLASDAGVIGAAGLAAKAWEEGKLPGVGE